MRSHSPAHRYAVATALTLSSPLPNATAAPPLATTTVPTPTAPKPPRAARTLEDYRHFRALAIDLLGRMPRRSEVAAFEHDDFDIDAWVQRHLDGTAYADRLTRVYMDVLRLEIGTAFQYVPPSTTLRRVQIVGPDGKPMSIYYRLNQRRARPETDGELCLTMDETGLQFPENQPARGRPMPVSKASLDAHTVVVRPWWLYRDYRSASPVLRLGDAWKTADPEYAPVDELRYEPDGKTPTTAIRVCREEAGVADVGTIFATGRKPNGAQPFGRLRPLPLDDGYAVAHKGEPLSCRSSLALTMSADCGCGVGLEHCLPGDANTNDPRAFAFPNRLPLGLELPTGSAPQNIGAWHRLWWSQEAVHFLHRVFADDRDFRDVLTARYTWVNGPLAQFYKASAPAACCGPARAFGMTEEKEPLFEPARVPASLLPHDIETWAFVEDRGPRAAGILTMPAFLAKYASRRARGAALYNAFMCKSFASGNVALTPSSEPNLMIRPGCANCHGTLEPLAAYFSRVVETSWTYLPAASLPLSNARCKPNAQGKLPGFCNPYYDPAFVDEHGALLRGAYGSQAHAEGGPIAAGRDIAASRELATCVVERVASSFLGRPLTGDDAELTSSLAGTFVEGGYRVRPLVRALVSSSRYRAANNLRSGDSK